MSVEARGFAYECGRPVFLELKTAQARWEDLINGSVRVGAGPHASELTEVAVGLVVDRDGDDPCRFIARPARWTGVRLLAGEQLRLPFRLTIPWGLALGATVSVQMALDGRGAWPPTVTQLPLTVQPCALCLRAAETVAELTGTREGKWGFIYNAATIAFRAARGRDRTRHSRVALQIIRRDEAFEARLSLARDPTWKERLTQVPKAALCVDSIPLGSGCPEAARQALIDWFQQQRTGELPVPARPAPPDPCSLPKPAGPVEPLTRA